MAPFDLTGKVALITGASRGIGAAVAQAYVSAGAQVVISSRKLENVQVVADELNTAYPGRVLPLQAHAGRREETERLVAETVEHFGRLDIAVNNAATNPHFGLVGEAEAVLDAPRHPHFGPLLTSEPSHWEKILEVNVQGYFWLCQLAAQQMQRQGSGGKIINMASVAGLRPGPMMGIYSISKAAVIMMTQVLAAELGADNIQVNAIAPGFIKTKFSRALWDNPMLAQEIESRTPAGRIAEPEEVAGIALYLASPASDFTTGGVFTVDGGYTLT